jgi:WD40 repeat protein
VFGFALSADGKRLAVADPSTLRIWDMEKGRQIESFPQVVGISTLALSPDGQRLALPFESGVKIVSLSGEKTEVALDDRPARPTNLCFSPDGQTLALAMTFLKGEDVKSEIRLFDAIHGKLIHKFSKAEGATLALQFSVDGRTLFAASTYQVSEWDTDLGTEIRRFRPTPSRTACFSTDGERVACAGLDATVNIWDVRAGQHLLSLKGFSGQVASLSFNPAGTRLAASGFEGNTVQIRVWDGTPLERKPITIPDKSPP